MNIRQVRTKIKSVSNVKKITRAMEMVSAIKMRKAQQKAVEGKPYQEKLNEVIKRIVGRVDLSLSPLLLTNKSEKELVIVVSSNKGLCGGFNFNLFRFLIDKVDLKKADFITVGKKGSFFVNKMSSKILADFSSSAPLNNVTAVFNLALDNFLKGNYVRVSLVYNSFVSPVRSETVMETLLPFALSADQKEEVSEYLIEPSPVEIIDALLRSYLEERIRFSIIQSEAGEHSARMIAMKNATDNAEEVTYNLTLLRNKLRQEKITNELLDMITAKESVES